MQLSKFLLLLLTTLVFNHYLTTNGARVPVPLRFETDDVLVDVGNGANNRVAVAPAPARPRDVIILDRGELLLFPSLFFFSCLAY
jgi:hypothetical protein